LSLALAALFLAAAPAHAQDTAPGWVVIPVDEYRALRTKAFPAEREPEPPPVEATLTRVDYTLRVNGPGDLATGQASLTVDVIKDGWVRVAVPSGLLVREARLDGKPVSLVSGGPGKASSQLSAVLAHPGRAVLQLEIALPVNASAGEERITLPSTGSGVTRAEVALPRQGVDVHLSGGLLTENAEAGGASKWLAYGHGNEPMTFTWRRKIDDHHITLPLRARGSITQLVGLGEDATSLYAEADLEVLQGAAKEAHIQLPANITINQVSGAMVADWEVKAGELRVIFLEPVESSTKFVVSGDTHTPREGQVEIPLLRLLNVERENGGVAVEVLGAGEIKDQKQRGLEVADASELGDGIAARQSPSMVAYKFRPGDTSLTRALSVDVARYAQQAVLMAVVDEARYHVLLSNEGKVLVQARYAVRNNSRNFLKLTLPQGAMIWSATIAGKPVRPGEAPDRAVLLPLEKSRAGDDAPVFPVEVIYLSRQPAWTDKGKATMVLPALDIPISRSAVLLYHAPQFKVTEEPGTFRVEPYEAPFSPVLIASSPTSGVRGRDDKQIDGQNINDRFDVGTGTGLDLRPGNKPLSQSESRALEEFRKRSLGGKSAKVLPIRVSFPAFGTSMFMVTELTAENHSPAIELSYQREKKDGVQ
jgi:hypothetical protein